MKRWVVWGLLLALIVFSVTAWGYTFPRTQKGLHDFIDYVRENWTYEADYPGEPCQDPATSLKTLRGDCDDFAVMIAAYLQEYWNCDTFIINVNIEGEGKHWVAFALSSWETFNRLSLKCQSYPYIIKQGRYYIPVDWTECPEWTWKNPGPVSKEFEWYELVGKPI